MGQIVRFDDYQVADPLEDPKIRKLVKAWFVHGVNGGFERYGLVILTPFLGSVETDPLAGLRLSIPKLMLCLQPVVAAWGHDEYCDTEYVQRCIPDTPRLVVQEFLNELVQVDAITQHEEDGCIYYRPSRRSLYRWLEIVGMIREAWVAVKEEAPGGIEAALEDREWVSIELPIPE